MSHCSRAIFLITRSENTDCKCFYAKKKFYFGSISDSMFPFKTSGDTLDAGWLVLGLSINVGAAFTLLVHKCWGGHWDFWLGFFNCMSA